MTSHHTLSLYIYICINQLGMSFMSSCICRHVIYIHYVFIKARSSMSHVFQAFPGSQVQETGRNFNILQKASKTATKLVEQPVKNQ